MDELLAELRARRLVNDVAPTAIPCPVVTYVEHVGAKLRIENLPDNEPGYTMEVRGQPHIVVNGNDRTERQRFTACHELGHIVLNVPSEHGTDQWWSYRARPLNERCCDIFAAELLLPYTLFKPDVDSSEPGFAALQDLADRFDTSLTATGSRFAAVASVPCAFILAEGGQIRYAARSPTLRDADAWIQPRAALPRRSISARVRAGMPDSGTHEIDADEWFSDWTRGGFLLEEARHLGRWDQTLTLLWFDSDEPTPTRSRAVIQQDEEAGLQELDGILPWPSKRCRR